MFRSSAIVGRQRPAFRSPIIHFSPGAKMLLLLLLCGGALLGIHARTGASLAGPNRGAVTVQAADRGKPYFNLRDGRELQVAYRGEESLTTALRSGSAHPRSLASIDLDRDGTPDVVAGYSYNGSGLLTIQRGNPEAFAPKSDDVFARINQGYNPDSLLPAADVIQNPEAVDFVQVGDFNHDNQRDVLVAANGGGMFLLAGDGRGGLGAPERIALPGAVTALTAGEFRAADGWTDVAVGINGTDGPQLLIFGGVNGVTAEAMRLSLPAPATAVEFGEMDSSPFMGVAVATGSQIEIVHGWGRKQTATLESRVETVAAGGNVRGLAVGSFIWNREGSSQLAALGEDGTIRIMQRGLANTQPFSDAEITARARLRLQQKKTQIDVESVPGWQADRADSWNTVREVVTGNVIGADTTAQNLLLRAHVSFVSTDDLMVLSANQQRLDIVRQVDATAGSQANVRTTAGDMVLTTLNTAAAPATALALPQKLNGERSLLLLQAGSAAPTVIPLAPTATIVVDRTDDVIAAACTAAANDCSLRGAVQFANANPGTVITLATTTYVLNTNGANGCVNEGAGNSIGDLEVNTSTTFNGNGAANTIIRQAAATNDRVLCMDVPLTAGLTFAFSGMTITGGRDVNSNVGGGGFIGGARNVITNLTDVTFANNQTTGPNISGGGGVAITGGSMTITSCTFGAANLPGANRNDLTLGNASNSNSAGGLSYSPGDPAGVGGATGTLTVTGTTFTHNTSSSGSAGGGGMDVFNFNTSTGTANLSTSSFTSNQATGTASGGGINNESLTNVNISTTSFTSNSAGNRGGGVYVGGGAVLLDGTAASVTFTSNTATSGGSSVSTASAVNVSGTNTNIGGDIEVTTNGTWTNSAGSTLAPTNILLVGGTFTCNNSTMNVGGNLTIQSGAVAGGAFNGNTGTVNIAGNLSYSTGPATPTFTAGTNTFNFNGSGAQSISNSASITFNNLTDSNTAQPLTLNNSFAVGGNLTANVSTTLAPVAAAVISGAGTLTGTGTARVTRTAATADFSSQYTITNKTLTNLTVEYIGAAAQTGSALTYGGLKINNASGVTLAAGTTTVNGTLTLTTGALGVGTSTLIINNGTSVGTGSLTSGATGTVDYNQSSNGQSVLAANYGNLTFSNFTKTLPNGSTVRIAGTFTTGAGGGHTLTGSTIEFNGTSAQALPSTFTTYNNLTLNNTAGTSGFAGLTVNGLIRVQAGTFTSSSTYNNVQIDLGTTLAGTNATTINVSGNWTNNGTFTANGNTVNFNGSSAQSVGGTNPTTFSNLTNSNSAGINFAANQTVNGVLALTSGDITTGANILTMPATGSSSGNFDVVGNVKRTGFIAGGGANTLSFGNPNNQLTFTAGTAPTDVTVLLVKAAPATYAAAVQRNYTITPSSVTAFTGTLRLHYLDTELNGNTPEANLNLRRFTTAWKAVTPTVVDTTNNWVECNAVTGFSQWTFSALAPTASDGMVTGRIVDQDGNAVAGATINLSGSQSRETITDAAGSYSFDGVETNGFYTVTPSRANYTFSPANRSFSLLGVHTEASFTATANGDQANAIDTTEFFVRQQYLDFLGREPDPPGFNGWVNTIRNCAAGDASCDRVHVSESFFRSAEFQERGYFVYRFYSTALGRKPDFVEFTPDMARVSGFLDAAQLEAAKTAFANDFTARPSFAAQYNGLSNSAYVDALINTAAVTLSNRQALIDGLNAGTMTRAQALRQIAESNAVYQRYYNQAFVVMEYFGYLRRDPDILYLNWIDVLNQGGDSRHMVEGFVDATEYRNRFPR